MTENNYIDLNDPYNKNSKQSMSLLHVACANSMVEIVEYLLSKGASTSSRDPGGVTPIHLASQKGPVEVLNLFLNYKTSLFIKDDNQQTIAHHAARADAPGKVFDWIYSKWSQDKSHKVKTKTDVLDVVDKWNRTPLHWASVNGHRNAVLKLMDLGCDKKKRDGNGETPMEIAERRAKCGAAELRPVGMRASAFGDIAKLLGGSGSTKQVSKYT
ncbi:hypothetical protein AKO1_012207 [Acrasis kona]|uniref:Uncharacterized protein n=1 Tax=Acrasis kona TaxID=1008807 RepID=A0AAW2ZC08_9EUKA